MSNNEYEQQQFWNTLPEVPWIELMEDMLIWGHSCFKITENNKLERIYPLNIKKDGK